MDSSMLTIAAVAAAVIILFAAMVLRGQRDAKRRTEQRVHDSWGTKLPRLYLAEQIRDIRLYSDSRPAKPGRECEVDPITAADVELDRVFASVCRAVSAPGEEVLYAWLHHPLTDSGEIGGRIRQEDLFAESEELRRAAALALEDCGRLKQGSFYGALTSLDGVEEIGAGKYLVLGAATLAALAALFVWPVLALVLLVPVLFLDFRVHLGMKKKLRQELSGFDAVLKMEKAARKLVRTGLPGFEAECGKLAGYAGQMAHFKKKAFWVMSAGSYGTGFGDAVLEYVRMLFHPDLASYDAMLKAYRGNREAVYGLYEVLGTLDAAMSAASYRASLPLSARPVWASGNRASIHVQDLRHPLIGDAVPNTVEAEGGVLVTGTNASGKSTFLKSIALAAIMAQGIGIVCASSYCAPCFAIYTSMALTDNLIGGESYFVVEIRSLMRIWRAVEDGAVPVLALLDEVLRGTNTVERIAASSQILKELAGPGTVVFAATHDGELTRLLEGYYRNVHFEEQVRDGGVTFDYLLREGPARARNALRLLRESGCPAAVVEAAEEQAERFEGSGEWRLTL